MSEVEKMYENFNIKPKQEGYCDWDSDCPYTDIINSGCGDECPYWKYEDEATYPPFTPEKQLELIKWLIQKNFYDERIIRSNYEKTHFYCSYLYDYCESEQFEKFEEALANVFNYFWQDLTSEEQEQIRSILNG